MNNFQSAAGFAMASRARSDLLEARLQIDSISDDLQRRRRNEEKEQKSRDVLFSIKKRLLEIEKSLTDPHAIYELVDLMHCWFYERRLTEDNFSALSDKEYFLATFEFGKNLEKSESANGDLILIYHCLFTCAAIDYGPLYLLMRAKELCEVDEQRSGVIGKMFSKLIEYKAKPLIEGVANRFKQTELLRKFQLRVPSPVIAGWIAEAMAGMEDKFDRSDEFLKFMREAADHIDKLGGKAGLNEHDDFRNAIYAEMHERGLAYSPSPMPREDSQTYQIARNGNELGEFPLSDIKAMIASGQLAFDDYYLNSDNEWMPLNGLGLLALL